MQAKQVSGALAQQAESIAQYLLPKGKRMGTEWCAGNILGELGESLKIHLSGIKSGVWCDFATGESGDLLDLWCLKRNLTLIEALSEAEAYLGISEAKIERQKPKIFNKPKLALSTLDSNSQVFKYLESRGLFMTTILDFKIKQKDNDIVFPFIRDNEVFFVKYISLERPNGKKQVRCDRDCEPGLFGWHMIPQTARTITICEGEIDAMTLFQYGIPALSVPLGAGKGSKHEWIEYEYERLSIFDEIYLCLDNDSVGKDAAKEIAARLGLHRCRFVELPCKDANECLQNGFNADEINTYFRNALELDPQELKRFGRFKAQIQDQFYPVGGKEKGYNAPWRKTHNKILFRPSELSIWSGINGHGKSQFLGQIILGMLQQHARVCIASLELKPAKLGMRLIKQATGMSIPSSEYIDKIADYYNENLWLFDLIGNVKADRLLEVFRYGKQRYGIDVFVIDSFMMLGIAEDDYKAQKQLIERLCEFKNQHDCQVHIVVHPRKSLDETSMPGKMDYKGTGAISDLADNCYTIWRNKEKELLYQKHERGETLSDKELEKLEKPDTLWCCDKQRHGDFEGLFGFWFDAKTYQYLSSDGDKPRAFVELSCLND